MYPTATERPALGPSCATRSRRCGVLEGTSRSSCSRSGPARATTRGRRGSSGGGSGGEAFDVVHVHFGLVALPALRAGAAPARGDHPRTICSTRARGRPPARAPVPGPPRGRHFRARTRSPAPARAASRSSPAASTSPLPADPARRGARAVGPASDGPCLLFPHNTARAVKRFDRAQEAAGDTRLLTLGGVQAEEVPTRSTRPTPSSCLPRTRAWGSRCSRPRL